MILASLKQHAVYRRLFMTMMCLAIIVILIVILVSYGLFNQQYRQKMREDVVARLAYDADYLTTDVIERGNLLFSQLAYNSSMSAPFKALANTSSGDMHVHLYNAFNMLDQIRRESYQQFVDSILVYYPNHDMLISSTHGIKYLSDDSNKVYRELVRRIYALDRKNSWEILALPENLPGYTQPYAIVFGGVLPWASDNGMYETIALFTVNSSTLNRLMVGMAGSEQKNMLVSPEGVIVAFSDPSLLYHSLSEWQWGQEMMNGDSVYALDNGTDGQWEYISYPFSLKDWKLISGMRMDHYNNASRMIAIRVLIAALACFVISGVLVVMFSSSLYSPVKILMETTLSLREARIMPGDNEYDNILYVLQELSMRLDDAKRVQSINQPLVRHMLLHAIMKGRNLNTEEAMDRLEEVGIRLSHRYFCVLLIEWNEMAVSESAREDMDILALVNMLPNAFLSDDVCLYAYQSEDNQICILINSSEQDEMLTFRVIKYLADWFQTYDITCASAASDWVNSPEMIAKACEQAVQCMAKRFFALNFPIITLQNQESMDSEDASRCEEKAIQCLVNGQSLEFKSQAYHLLRIWNQQPQTRAEHGLQHFCDAICSVAGVSDRQHAPDSLIFPMNIFWHYAEFVEWVADWFPVAPKQRATQNRHTQLLSVLDQYIDEHIQGDLSLNALAEYLHFNPKYLSRLFKESMGINLTEYIKQKRLEKATELLMETSMSVEKISETVGYSSVAYFGRSFKEAYGCSTREYRLRELHKNL